LGVTSQEVIVSILACLDNNNVKQLIITLKSLREQGIEPSVLAKQLAAAIRETLLQQSASQPSRMLQLLEKLIEVPASADPYAALEVYLLQAVLGDQPAKAPEVSDQTTVNTAASNKEKQAGESHPKKSEPPMKQQKQNTKPATLKKSNETQVIEPEKEKSTKKRSSQTITEGQWPDVINEIKRTYNTLYGILRMAQPSFSDTTVTLTLAFAFHQKRLNEPKNRQVIAEAIEKVSGATPEILCIVGEKTTPPEVSSASESLPEILDTSGSNSLGTISNIFGGGELLES